MEASSVSRWNWNFFHVPQNSPEWKEAREVQLPKDEILTASVFPDFFGSEMGFRAWKDVAYDIKKELNPYAQHLVDRGTKCEPIAATQFCADLKAESWGNPKTVLLARPGLLVDKILGVGASIDRLLLTIDDTGTSWYNMEIKCPNPEYDLVDSPSGIKARILIQICVQMKVAKLDATYLYMWKPGQSVCFLAPQCDELWEFLWGLTPEFKAYYFKRKPKPHRVPFKIHLEELSKILDKWRGNIVKLWSRKHDQKSKVLLCELPSDGGNEANIGRGEPSE